MNPPVAENTAKPTWDRRANTPLAKARKSRTYAQKRVLKAKNNVIEEERRLAEAEDQVRELERLIAKGIRGLN